jgi:hypothetical protein
MPNPLSTLFIDSTWEQFRVAYYDAPNDYVYYCLWTDLTELDPNKNWFVVFNDFRPQALQYFIDNKLFTIEVDKKPEDINTPIPKLKGDTCEIAGETTKPMTRPSSKDILLNDRKTIDPRPNGVVRLLYRIEDASTKLNVEKIQVEYNKFTEQRQQKPLSKQIKNFIDDGKKKDFKINNISDIAKIANIRDLKDLNDFLKSTAQKSSYVNSKIGQSLGQAASGVNLDLAQAARDNAEPPVITRNQVYSQTLRDAEYLGDFAFFNFPAALSNVAEGTESFAGADNESVKALKDTLKKVNSELGKVYLMLNKWGLKPLIECLTALLIENLKAQGYLSLARALAEQLEELTKNYKSFGVEFDKYENFYKQIQKLWKNKSSSKAMGAVTKELKKQLDSLLLELGRQFINTLVQQCLLLLASNEPEGDFDYGSVQPQDLFEDPIAFQNTAATSLGKEFTGNDSVSFQNFINLTFSSLTGKEMCRLLEGQAEPLLLLQLQSFAEQTKVDTFFDDLYAYANFFYQLGLQSGTAFCKTVNETEPNVNPTADYCDTKTDDPTAAKVPASYGAPDVPQITVEDLANLLSEDAINNLLPDIDFSGLLNEAYRQAQEALYQYKINFDDDIANINKGLTKIEQESEVTDALKDIGIEPPDGNNANPIDFKTALAKVKPDNIPELSIATDLIDNGNRLGNRVRFFGGQFSSIIIEGDGSYKIETFQQYNLPNKGVTTNNGKSPLAILGESIEGQDSTDPVARKYDKNQFGTFFDPPKTTLDVYKSILKDVFNEFLTNFNNSIKNKTVLDVVSFYRKPRRKRVKDELCEYSKNREQSVAYSTDPSKEASIEALRIFVYTQMIELYPNFTSALLILPEEQATALIGATKNLVGEISKQIQTAAKDYLVEIPVRNILCEAGLTVQDLVEQEIKLLSKASSPATKDTLSISEILKKKIKNTATTSNALFKVEIANAIDGWYFAFDKAADGNIDGQTITNALKFVIDKFLSATDSEKTKIESFLFGQAYQEATVTFKSLDDYARFVVFVVKTLRICEDQLKVKVSNVDYKDFFTATASGNFETTFEYDNIILAKDTGSFAGQANIQDDLIQAYVDKPNQKVPETFSNALEIDKGINIFDAFKEDFFNDVLLNLIVEKSLAQDKEPSSKKFFFTLKPAIMRRFTGGVQPMGDLGVELADAKAAFKDFQEAQNPKTVLKSIQLWLLLLIMIPKMVIEAVKALLLSIVYAANPGIYFLIMLAQSLGLGFPDEFFDWLKKKTKEEILSGLDPESPEAKKLQAEIAEIDPEKSPILDLKCDI